MPKLFTCRAVLFDLDGVLVDSTASVGRVWGRWAESYGLNPEAVVHSAHGRRSIETIRQWRPTVDATAENRRVEQMEIDDTLDLRVINGARQLLASLPGESWAVVTSGTRALAQSRMRAAGLPAPKVLISADDVEKGKPDPEPWLKAATALGVEAADCLVIEDTPPGVASGHAAGMRVIALTTTYPANTLVEAEYVSGTLADVRAELGSGQEIRVTVQGCALP